ncbi:hypothetical protein KIW84_035375 [Lathyrus oleraceus]|uniref:Uncharacterized protein n=1 Tax=Pisum sativum TaxID=3888 RepID=A0A9D4Y2J7_PEA|nr:hypothetical protein KIW84_035375 [Pisum sativum]
MTAGDATDQVIRQVDKMIKSGDRFARDARVGKDNQPSTQFPASGELSRKRPVPHDNEQLANGHEAIAKRIRSGPSWNDICAAAEVLQDYGYYLVHGLNVKHNMDSVSILNHVDRRDRLLIQVLDDSDDESIQWLIKAEVSKWNQKGINIIYRHRLIRTGYKAGSLNSTMSCGYVKD